MLLSMAETNLFTRGVAGHATLLIQETSLYGVVCVKKE